ncbi:MAG: prepilin peptidase [Bryobacterales bacterium]|nr:prepilin peptidase [Bryobacterales bacterium]
MIEAISAAVFGLLIGSFLNVCIQRLPEDESVVRPRSRCPQCRHPIAWYDNIPLLSYLLLRARCRHCQERIPARYPIVEALTGALFAAGVAHFGLTLAAAKFCLLAALLVGLTFSDLETRILPDELTLGGLAAGLALAWFLPMEPDIVSIIVGLFGADWSAKGVSMAESAVGALIPAGMLWASGALFQLIRGKEGLGLGDVKMLAMMGAFLGLRNTVFALIVGSLSGSVLGLIYIKLKRQDPGTYELPFGTFLGFAALLTLLLSLRTG